MSWGAGLQINPVSTPRSMCSSSNNGEADHTRSVNIHTQRKATVQHASVINIAISAALLLWVLYRQLSTRPIKERSKISII